MHQHRKYKSRRGLSGYEVARHLLDAGGFSQVSVQPYENQAARRGANMKQLFLKKSDCDSRTLQAISDAAKEAAVMTQNSGPNFFSELRKIFWPLMPVILLAAWASFIVGLLHPRLRGLEAAGAGIFILVFLGSMLDLPRQWEASARAHFLLRHSQNFDVDELVRLKDLLRASCLRDVSQIFRAPLSLVSKKNGRS